jgi:hypothetical protein
MKNLIIAEALLKSIRFKGLNYCAISSGPQGLRAGGKYMVSLNTQTSKLR